MKPPTKPLGNRGERLARDFLENKGLHFITQNFRTRFGEIDLIFQDHDQLVFVEVKTRSRAEQGIPEEAVTHYKLRQITRVAEFFFQHHPHFPQHGRIDVVAIETTTAPLVIRHLENVS